MFDDYFFPRQLTAAERRRRAEREAQRLARKGDACAPVIISGQAIAHTFWGRSWCENIERYSDYYNRLDRGRSYVRTGAVVDLAIEPGVVKARVAGTRLYSVEVKISALPPERWRALCRRCSGAIDTLVELLQGRFSRAVMDEMCARETGLFPFSKEIAFACSCPDAASMCKHVAAVLYGIGARLDAQPQLLFVLRGVDHNELVAAAGRDPLPAAGRAVRSAKRLENVDLAELFGIDIATDVGSTRKRAKKKRRQG